MFCCSIRSVKLEGHIGLLRYMRGMHIEALLPEGVVQRLVVVIVCVVAAARCRELATIYIARSFAPSYVAESRGPLEQLCGHSCLCAHASLDLRYQWTS